MCSSCRRSPDCEPKVEKRAVLAEGAQRWVVHAKEEVQLARLDSLAAVERGAPGMLCAVEELLVELRAVHVVACVVARIVVVGGNHA